MPLNARLQENLIRKYVYLITLITEWVLDNFDVTGQAATASILDLDTSSFQPRKRQAATNRHVGKRAKKLEEEERCPHKLKV